MCQLGPPTSVYIPHSANIASALVGSSRPDRPPAAIPPRCPRWQSGGVLGSLSAFLQLWAGDRVRLPDGPRVR
jgi:hypothetical protein